MSRVDFTVVGQSREFRMRELIALAARHLWHQRWRAIGSGLVTLGLMVLVVVALALPAVFLGVFMVPGWEEVPGFITICMWLAIVGSALFVGWNMALEGYLWCVLGGCVNGRMQLRGLFQVWRQPWRRRLILLGLLRAICWGPVWPITALATAILFVVLPGSPTGGLDLWILLVGFGFITIAFVSAFALLMLSHVTTLLAGPIMLGRAEPRLGMAIREQWKMIRGRPRRMLGTMIVLAGLQSLAMVLPPFAASIVAAYSSWFALWVFVPVCSLILLALMVGQSFFLAALCLSIYGQLGEPKKAEAEAPAAGA